MSLRSDIAKEIAPLLAEIRDLSTAHAPTLAMIDALMAQIPAKAASAAKPKPVKIGTDFATGSDWTGLATFAHPGSKPSAYTVEVWDKHEAMVKMVGVKMNFLPAPLVAQHPIDYMTLSMISPVEHAQAIAHATKVCADKIGNAVKQAVEDGVIESLLHKPTPSPWSKKIAWGGPFKKAF